MHILINITAILAIFLMYYYNIYEFIYCCFSLLRRVKGIVKMFEKQFAKYARAVSDERERRSLYRLYCAKLAAAIITVAISFVIVLEALLFDDALKTSELTIVLVTMILLLAASLTTIVLHFVFRHSYNRILNRPRQATEMPEVASYREKTREINTRSKKFMNWPIVISCIGVVFLIAAVVCDVCVSEDLSAISHIGVVVFGLLFGLCLLVSWLLIFAAQCKKNIDGKTLESETADEARAIDAAQGREHKYTLEEDKNARSYRYLYPNLSLRSQAEKLGEKQSKAALLGIIISALCGVVIVLVFFSPFIFGVSLWGFAEPFLVTLMFVCAFVVSLPYNKKLKELEEQQKAELEENPAFAKNLWIFRKYKQYEKEKMRIVYALYILSVAVGYVLAALFPASAWSLCSATLLFLGNALNVKFVTELRKEVRPAEEEIDREQSNSAI